MERNFSVLIPDGESLLAVYVINCLCLVDTIKIYVLGNAKKLAIKYSRYVHHYSYYPKTDDPLDWITRIKQEEETFKLDLVMPISELGIETVIKYKGHLNKDKLLALADVTNFQMANNKRLLADHMSVNNIPHPKTSKWSSDISAQIQLLNFPIIVKPIEDTGGGKGVVLIRDENEFRIYAEANTNTKERIIQDYVEGYDAGCSVLCKEGSILAYTIQKAVMLEKDPFKATLEAEFFYDEGILDTVSKLMTSLNWSGIAHIDLRFDQNSYIFKVIEINPRIWGSLNASAAAGVNFPYLHCIASLGESFKTPKYDHIRFLNFKGLFLKIFKNVTTLFKFKYILNQTEMRFVVNDPSLTFWKYFLILQDNLFSRFRRLFKM
jgi:predicted ATP-grasp superfamily ATP-dependent carboligase